MSRPHGRGVAAPRRTAMRRTRGPSSCPSGLRREPALKDSRAGRGGHAPELAPDYHSKPVLTNIYCSESAICPCSYGTPTSPAATECEARSEGPGIRSALPGPRLDAPGPLLELPETHALRGRAMRALRLSLR